MPTAGLHNKTILVLSPQSWGTIYLSKHHYAIELAKLGNTVYFLNPPAETGLKKGIALKKSEAHPNLFIIDHALPFPYKLKFHIMSIFHWLMKFHLRRIIKKIPGKIDIVWSFDIGNLYPFKYFPNMYRVFHPVDEPLNKEAMQSARGAQVIFSVTKEILQKYHSYNIPSYFINHGVSTDFLNAAAPKVNNDSIHVGFSGNLTRNDIDREVLLEIIKTNRDIVFNFWGPVNSAQSNIGGAADDISSQFIAALKQLENVILHGAVPSAKLATAIQGVDAFLICYDVNKDQSKGTNYHKVMEYISTGKVIVANNITTYAALPNLVQMVAERDSNAHLLPLFNEVIKNIHHYNSPALQEERRCYAASNTYQKQIQKIEKLLYAE
ncbi:MAG: hypothetical protein QM791_02690 [Ferruginibacter sp.]